MSAMQHTPNEWLIRSCLLAAMLIHLLPLLGLFGNAGFEALYGLAAIDSGTTLLLQHRALMFGLMGALLGAAIWQRSWRSPAMALVLLSDLGFLLLAFAAEPLNAQLRRVAAFDAVAVTLICVAFVAQRRATG